ncbi:uncharacterized protein [Miscanthus floridulus]|uniref:uncharacterized protein n=1 Tax=Miscanthus floridulus TaxID=154761 RepID=UPI003459CA91
MQIMVSLGATSLIVLLDSGSTHNFIAEDAALRTGLPIQPRPRLTAIVANGERVACPGVIHRAPISIDNTPFHIDLFVMPLAGYDMVLGTQWMATLGKIIWDFTERSMSFQRHDHTIMWAGVATSSTTALHATVTSAALAPLLDVLLAAFEDVFAEPTGLPPK